MHPRGRLAFRGRSARGEVPVVLRHSSPRSTHTAPFPLQLSPDPHTTMQSITSFLALALLPAATRAVATPVSCLWHHAPGASNLAPFHVLVDNQHTNTVKLRVCPAGETRCSGAPNETNSYIDCNATLPAAATSVILLNSGAGYIVAVLNGTAATTQLNPVNQGAGASCLEWPAEFILKAGDA